MKKKMNEVKRNKLGLAIWNGFGSACWIYNVKKLSEKEKLVDAENCSEKLKKFAHGLYKVDYVLMIIFSCICAYAAGKGIAEAFTPEPLLDEKENTFKEVE